MRIRSLIAATAVATSLSIGSFAIPVHAEEQKPEEMISEGAGLIINAIELMLLAIPTYQTPEILPNGDIIIRRNHPDGDRKKDDEGLDAPGEEL